MESTWELRRPLGAEAEAESSLRVLARALLMTLLCTVLTVGTSAALNRIGLAPAVDGEYPFLSQPVAEVSP